MNQPEPVTATAPPLRGPVLMNQDWRDLTFVHWAVDPERVAARMPPGVRPDVLEGRTYVGLVPFLLADAAPGRARGVPWLGTFLETNIRLYSVDSTGRRGVVFLSLDCERLPVVAGAQAVFGLPYRWARMSHRISHRMPHRRKQGPAGEEHVYSARLLRRGAPVTNRVVVRVGSSKAEPTELDHFLSARWGLHTRRLGRTLYVPNRHGVWPLHSAELLQLDDGLLASVGLGELASRTPDHVAFSPGVHTEFGFPLDARRDRANDPPGGPATRRRADR